MRVRCLIVAISLLTPLAPAAAQPADDEAERYQERLLAYHRGMAMVTLFDEHGPTSDEQGTFLAPDEVVVRYDPASFARRIEIRTVCCGEYEVRAVIGGDLKSGVLILQVAPAGAPGDHEAAPVKLAIGDIDASHVEAVIGPTEVRNPAGEVAGIIAPSIYATDATWVTYAGQPRRLRVPWGVGTLFPGAPIFNAEGDLAGILIALDGRRASLVATADQIAAAPRIAPVSFEDFRDRELGSAERVAVLRLRAEHHREAEEYEQSILVLREALALALDDWLAWFHLGISLDLAGQPVESLRALLRSQEIEPARAETLYSTGVTLARMGYGGAAAHYFQAAVSRDERHTGAHANLAGIAMAASRRDHAAAHMRRAVESDPRSGQYDGMLQTLEAQLAAGREQLAEAESSDPQTFSGRLELARLRWEVGEADAALQAAAEAEVLAPEVDDLFEARGARLLWLIYLARFDEAIALAQLSAVELKEHPRGEVIEPFVHDQVELAQGRLESLLDEPPPR